MRRRSRDVALIAAGIALGAAAPGVARTAAGAVLGPAVFDWSRLVATPTPTGAVRQVVRRPTATLRELEIHVTTLDPGRSSHPPHTHPNEELVIVDAGTVETLSAGTWQRVGPGSVIFNASNAPHALRNVGTAPARYHVVNWSTDATPER
ncbi:cupin domain-containing protein [Sphingomonas sp. BK235]|jgi:XRE family transcriptional regulator, regulator of sulfur utilization|uniref:cupin domain-containing protein n=1 Tax=Sphingomonas sp. BK235 TaxID=2512131 RepID=UPI001045DBE2|nr:cupin domain-containing protein [Sphingomonas sp. BK235]TCP35072.1 quercetin dioxygenase-like cupin family protein [Sphingomonas sp. BK235]